jgi:hypothetical protein
VAPIPRDVDPENRAWLSETARVCSACNAVLANSEDTLSSLLAGRGVIKDALLSKLEARARTDRDKLASAFERFMRVTKDMRVLSTEEAAAAKMTTDFGDSLLQPR